MPSRRHRSRIAVLLSAMVIHFTVHAQSWKFEAYPEYHEVLDRVYSTYAVGCQGCVVNFEKRPQGWFIELSKGLEKKGSHLIWSFDQRAYAEPDLAKLDEGGERGEAPSEAEQRWMASYFRACPYYGYPGWFLDVIDEYGKAGGLPDRVRYGVARAYIAAARCRLGSFLLEDCPEGYCHTNEGLDRRLDAAQLKDYRELLAKGIDGFGSLARDNPDFQTRVGEIALKYAHEPMTAYMDLLIVNEDEAARSMLRPGLYDPFYTAMARNYLTSCERNAILFTNGDSDSYPLWYVQAAEGYRTDVLVLNLSLLNLPQYVSRMRQGHLGAPPLELSLSDAEYADRGYDVTYTDRTTSDTIDALAFMRELPLTAPQAIGGMRWMHHRYARATIGSNGTISWELPKYLLRSGLVVLDIITNNASRRPIHWAVTVGPDNFIGAEKHLIIQGFAYRLGPPESGTAINMSGSPSRMDGARSAGIFLNAFDWSGLDRATTNKSRVVMNYVLQMSYTAEALLLEGDTTHARQLLDAIIVHFPDSVWKYDRIMLPAMERYYSLGANDAADQIALRMAHNLKTVPGRFTEYDRPPTEDLHIRELVLERIRQQAKLHGREGVVQALDALPTGWPAPVFDK